MNPEEVKKATEEAQKEWEKQIAETDATLKTTHTKKEYTFSQVEKAQILKIVGMNAFARQIQTLSQQLIDNLLNLTVLPRLNIVPTSEKRLLYEPSLGRVMIWEPRVSKTKVQAEPTLKTS